MAIRSAIVRQLPPTSCTLDQSWRNGKVRRNITLRRSDGVLGNEAKVVLQNLAGCKPRQEISKSYSVKSRMSIAIVQYEPHNLCISRISTSRRSQHPQWEDTMRQTKNIYQKRTMNCIQKVANRKRDKINIQFNKRKVLFDRRAWSSVWDILILLWLISKASNTPNAKVAAPRRVVVNRTHNFSFHR